MIDFRECSHELNLELTEHKFIPKIEMKQYDSKSRYIKVKLYNKGNEFDVTDKNLSFRAVFKKPDETIVFTSCKVITEGNENFVLIPVSSNTLAVVGRVITELVIMQGAEIFSSKLFYIACLPSLHANKGAIQSSDDYSGLLESIIKVEELLKDFEHLNSIVVMHHVIDVTNDTKTISFANWNEWKSYHCLEVFLAGVKQIEGVDYTLDSNTKTINMIGNKTFKDKDQVLLCSFRRAYSTEVKDPAVSADIVTLTTPILGANNVQDALQNLLIKLGDYVTLNKYEQEIANVNDLETNDKTVVGSINELKDKLDKIEGSLGNVLTNYRKLVDTVTLVAKAQTINIPIADYNSNTDDLNVYIAGAKMVEGIAYSLNKNQKTITCLNGMWDENVQIYFEVIKFN